MNYLADLRLCLVEAKAELRAVKDAHETVQAIAEQAAIERLNGSIGKNEAERARNLTVALLDDTAYNKSLVYLRRCECAVDQLTAQIATAEDEIRANEARIREKLADGLMGKRADNLTADQAFDLTHGGW